MEESSAPGCSVCQIFPCTYSIWRTALLFRWRGYHRWVLCPCVCFSFLVGWYDRCGVTLCELLFFYMFSILVHYPWESWKLISSICLNSWLAGTIYYGDLRRFDPQDQTWTYLSGIVQGAPSGRELHCFTSDTSNLYLFGGLSSNSSECCIRS